MGLPPKLCWHALKMFGLTEGDGGGIQRATNFLWSTDGQSYCKRMADDAKKKKKKQDEENGGRNKKKQDEENKIIAQLLE